MSYIKVLDDSLALPAVFCSTVSFSHNSLNSIEIEIQFATLQHHIACNDPKNAQTI